MAGKYRRLSNDKDYKLMRYLLRAGNEKFEFVNLSKPQENLNPANRRLVRRNATLHRSRGRRAPQTPEEGSSKISEQDDPKMGVRLRLFPIGMQKYMYQLLEYGECDPRSQGVRVDEKDDSVNSARQDLLKTTLIKYQWNM
jgi:hypothetical protein